MIYNSSSYFVHTIRVPSYSLFDTVYTRKPSAMQGILVGILGALLCATVGFHSLFLCLSFHTIFLFEFKTQKKADKYFPDLLGYNCCTSSTRAPSGPSTSIQANDMLYGCVGEATCR